jgi:polysaccharide export outer membrane protein
MLLAVCLVLPGCAGSLRDQPSASEMDGQARESQREYVIGPLDQLAISVWRQQELNLPSVAVRLDGRISFPLLDDVVAAGKTPIQLKEELTEQLAEYITAPHVTVVVTQINSKNVYVLGEVTREGPVFLRSGMRVVDAIAVAGGFSAFAGPDRVKVIRNLEDGGPVEFTFDYEDYVNGKDLDQNILLLPGDRIIVPDDKLFWH